ncbi:coiled-coil domain-containing protein [Catellatospora bangladeshensis]|uniref:ARB-07466-like C-terminal domain-containing protein n=1 Tax=Catellatospora bangladeshensis TaxID=310355 RepID=A0A8J3JTE8_9ACTN|nr:hypothetical protein [Catellatospora bangladeshensis]GIF86423.1 hypothetical protein Cba03nite_77720 [Catellatospora bangladeshensis]
MFESATPARRRCGRIAAAVAVAVALLAGAAPAASAAAAEPDDVPETASPKVATLRANLETAATAYVTAEAALGSSRKRQAELAAEVKTADRRLDAAREQVAKYASRAYRTGRLGVLGMIVRASSQDEYLARIAAVEQLAAYDDARLRELAGARATAAAAKASVDAEVREQARQVAEMSRRKKAMEVALSAAGGYAAEGWVDPASPLAAPAPRNRDGSWPREKCTIDDPTTSGCITPRTLHALRQAQQAGFKRLTSCHRSGGRYEHPTGRACDFATNTGGFSESSAKGEARVYGDRLASFFIKNARRLGVLYVVFYCKIWLPGSGWQHYDSGSAKCGSSPSADHTNHVHLSVY